jgi:hypothetical protein
MPAGISDVPAPQECPKLRHASKSSMETATSCSLNDALKIPKKRPILPRTRNELPLDSEIIAIVAGLS